MNFRPATMSDLETIIEWIPDADSCLRWAGPKVQFPLTLKQLAQAIEFDTVRSYTLEDTDATLAFGQIRVFADTRGHLSRIIVNPATRGRGIGRLFGEHLINEAKKLNFRPITLHVVTDNAIAIHVYEKLGFMIPNPQPEGIRDGIFYMELAGSAT